MQGRRQKPNPVIYRSSKKGPVAALQNYPSCALHLASILAKRRRPWIGSAKTKSPDTNQRAGAIFLENDQQNDHTKTQNNQNQ